MSLISVNPQVVLTPTGQMDSWTTATGQMKKNTHEIIHPCFSVLAELTMLMKLAVDGCGEEHSGVCRGELGETVCSSGYDMNLFFEYTVPAACYQSWSHPIRVS